MDTIYAATCIALVVFIASVISVELALSAEIIEITVGVITGNFMGLESAPWMDFLAGAEVDPRMMREKFKESLLIGGLSFIVPYLAAITYCHGAAGWTWNAALIAGCALSTTPLAVVYAVLVETGLTKTEIGKIIMAATFVTISSLYGLQAGYIDRVQFSVLVAVVIGTAIIPTFIAQR